MQTHYRLIARPMTWLLSMIASVVVPPVVAGAATHYVATAGSDSQPGTFESPWQTLRFGVAQLQPGDTLYIRGGTYIGSANSIDSSLGTINGGTSWATPITIAGYPSEVVTLQPPVGYAAIALMTAAQHYLIFQDLVV